MKTINIILKGLLAAAALVAGFTSCEKTDYPDRFRPTDGKPTVYGVRYAETGIQTEQAFMEDVLCILGENLTSVNRLFFNDQEAVLNTSFITANTLIVSVPKTMAVEKTDKIYLINKAGETVEHPFKVLPPAPRVNELSFEFAGDGEEVAIYGNYFYEDADTPISVLFAGAEVPHEDITIVSLSEIKVIVPAGAQEGKVKVQTPSGLGQSGFVFRDSRGLLFDFDGTNGLYTINKGWHAVALAEGGVSGQCLLLSDGSVELKADGSDWVDAPCHFEYWAGNWQDPETYGTWDGRRLCDIIDFEDFSNMSLKFEVNIPADNAWTGCPLQVIFSDVTLVSNGNAGVLDIYGNTLAGCNNTYMNNADISLPRYLWRPWAATGSYDTGGKWQTVTIPISSFNMFWDGSSAIGTLTKESFANLELFFAAGSTSEGSPCKPVIKVDNIRVVPNK